MNSESSQPGAEPTTPARRFRDREVVLGNGVRGVGVEFPSASPHNYHQAISRPQEMPAVSLDGKLFLPPAHDRGGAKLPAVIVAPGSLGVTETNLRHAETLTSAGWAVLVIDPFGPRGVTSTTANQVQFSFAASALDVLMAWKLLAQRDDIQPARIGAQGHSRGGTAVLTAATRCFADAVLGEGRGLHAVLSAYPWSGHQFLDPRIGATRVRILMGDRDEWCSPMQAQGHWQAMRLSGGDTSLRLVGGAHHSFDRGSEIISASEAKVTPAAPTAYIAADGSFLHPLEDEPNPELVDRDLMVYALKAGYSQPGPRLGSNRGEAELFRADMLRFWREAFA